MDRENCELTSAIKLAKSSLNEHLISKRFENSNEKIQIKNAVLFFTLASKFNLSDLNITVFRYIERCFNMIVETESFLELDFKTVSKILASSSLQIDSEVEVYNAANKWFNHNIEKRRSFASKLILKVRLSLLSEHGLNYLKNESFKNIDCLKVLKNRDNFYKNVSTYHNKSRQCNQNMFQVILCGGIDFYERKPRNQALVLDVNMNEELNYLPLMLEERYLSRAVCLKGEVYVFGGIGLERKRLKSVEKYSPVSKTWKYVCDLPDERLNFCACSFMDNIYLFGGGIYESGEVLKSCFEFNAKISKWNEVKKMCTSRKFSACAIYEENIVVSGGIGYNLNALNTVESYDVFADTWTKLPNMIVRRSLHSLVCVKGKLFAIGGGARLGANCEVFDKISNMFVIIETPRFISSSVQAVSIESRIFVFQNNTRVVLCYDVMKDEWFEDYCGATENIDRYSTVKVPFY